MLENYEKLKKLKLFLEQSKIESLKATLKLKIIAKNSFKKFTLSQNDLIFFIYNLVIYK